MTIRKTEDCEVTGVERFLKLQLAHAWKKIGFYALIGSIVLLFVNRFTSNSEVLREILRITFQVALIVIALSKEKIEDELIQKMRLQSFYVAFITGAFYVIALPYIGLGLDYLLGEPNPHKEPLSAFLIISQFVGVQIMCFEILKRRFQ